MKRVQYTVDPASGSVSKRIPGGNSVSARGPGVKSKSPSLENSMGKVGAKAVEFSQKSHCNPKTGC